MSPIDAQHVEGQAPSRNTFSVGGSAYLYLIIVMAAFLRIWHINWGLPDIFEEAVPLRFAMKLWDLQHHPITYDFFIYPSLTYFVNYVIQASHFLVGLLMGVYPDLQSFIRMYETDPTVFVILARLVSVGFDLGTIAVAYILAREVANRATALLTAFLIGINALHISESHLINVDTPFAFFSVLSMLFLYRMYKTPERTWYILSGVAIGLAAATKYNGALLVLILLIAHAFRSSSAVKAVRSLKDLSLLLAVAVSGAVFALCNPFILLHFGDFLAKFQNTAQHMEYGHLGIDPNQSTLGYYALQSFPSIFGIPLTMCVLASLVSLLISRKKENYLLLSFPLLFLLALSSWQMRADRYILPLLPFLILICSLVLAKSWNAVTQYVSRFHRGPYRILFAVRFWSGIALLLAIVFPTFSSVLRYEHGLTLPDTRKLAKEWIERQLPAGSAVVMGQFGITLDDSLTSILIPFSATASERLTPFYDTRWYEDADLLITSDYDYGRYLQEPQRFKEILSFYDSLRTRWTMVGAIQSNEQQSGPSFWFYRRRPEKESRRFDEKMFTKLAYTAPLVTTRGFLSQIGTFLLKKGKLEKCEQVLQFWTAIDSSNPDSHRKFVQALMGLGKKEEALQEMNLVLRLVPKDAAMLATKGDLLVVLGRVNDAEEPLKQAIALDPHLESPYLFLNIVYAARNDVAAQIDNLRRYRDILPNNSDKQKRIDQQLERLNELISSH